MKFINSVLAVIFLLHFAGRAQDGETSANVPIDSLSRTVDIFFVNQLALSYQCFVSDNRAWSILAAVSGSVYSQSSDASSPPLLLDANGNSFSLSVSPQMQWFTGMTSERIRLFAGAGPTVRYSRSYSSVDYGPSSYSSSSVSRSFEVGILLTGGLDVRALDPLSFVAKYDLYGTYGKEIRENESEGMTRSNEYKIWRLYLSSLRLGIGVHF